MFEQPPAWMPEYLRKSDLLLSPPTDLSSPWPPAKIRDFLNDQQEQRWRETIGIPAEEIYATIIVPIHNEQKTLPSVLGALMLSDIPDSAHLQFLFIVNGSTDDGASRTIVEQFLSDLGEVAEETIPVSSDSSLNAKTVSRNNLRFSLIGTDIASKTNALNIGNKIALDHGSVVTINLDANNWVEPDAILNLLAKAYPAILKDEALVFGSKYMIAYRPSALSEFLKGAQKQIGLLGTGYSSGLGGWLMAWNTLWLDRQGGFPAVTTDDYTLSLLTRRDGKEVMFAQNARVWGYFANNLKEKLSTYIRLVKDKLQVADYFQKDEQVLKLIEGDNTYMRPLYKRLNALIDQMLHDPFKAGLFLLKFMAWEYALFWGKREYQKNSQITTWEAIDSTR